MPSDDFIKNLFSGPPKPKTPAITPQVAPSTSSAQIQASEEDARRRALLSRGRSSTVVAGGGNGLGNVG